MDPDYRYKAFLSYSHADRKWARWLHRALENYRTPDHLVSASSPRVPVPGRIAPVFRDRDELPSSPELGERIDTALRQSENLIVLCSPRAAASQWVNREVEVFKSLGRSERVFCVIVDGDPGAPGTDADCFPPAIRVRYDADGNKSDEVTEPVAADARPEGDGKTLALLKVLAGLLNVGLDDLRQRELQRRQRRMALATTASLAIAGVTIALAILAVIARNEAQQRRIQAEELLKYMVGDLRDNLEPLGRLDLLEGVVRQADEYFATVDIDALSDEELIRRAEVMTQLGEIRTSQLEFEEARKSFVNAVELSGRLADNQPDNPTHLFNRGQAEFWIGYVHWRSGNLDEAAEWLARYRDSSIALLEFDANNPDWIREVGFGYHNFAVVSQERGDVDAAIGGFQEEIAILERLVAADDSVPLHRDLVDARSWLGNVTLLKGQLDEALAHYSRNVTEIEMLVDRHPDNVLLLDDLAYGEYFVADVLLAMGRLEAATSHTTRSRQLFDELVSRDPENTDWLRASNKPRILEARRLIAAGSPEAALQETFAVIAVLESLVDFDKADHNVLDDLAQSKLAAALAYHATGDADRARRSVDEAIDSLQTLRAQGRINSRRAFNLINAYLLSAELFAGDHQRDRYNEQLVAAENLLDEESISKESHYYLDPRARLLAVRGNDDGARQVIGELDARRYLPLIPWPD